MTGSDRQTRRGASDHDYEQQFTALWQKAYMVAHRVLGSRPAAEDVAQEAMARAYSWWRRISTSPQGWVAKVAYGLAIDHLRKQRSARRILGDEENERPAPDAAVEDRMDLMDAIERLPRRQRQVVVLRYLADQSEADTAKALGVKVPTVRRHAERGLSSLGGHLVTDLREG